jgi:hypothetical protein
MTGEIIENAAQFAMHASLWGPVVAFVLTAVVVEGVSVTRRVAASFLSAVAVFALLTGFWAGVLLRDGLGPDVTASEGWGAVGRSAGPLALGVVLAAAFGAAAYTVVKRAPRRPERGAA